MSRKLTIRRVGNHIPTIVLVVFLFLCITIAWLSLIGIPGNLLRRIEQCAANEGIYIKIESLQLEPSKGLAIKANKLKLYAQPDSPTPLADMHSAIAALRFSDLLCGEIKLNTVRLKKANAYIPISNAPGQFLRLHDLNLAAETDKHDNLKLTAGSINLHGITLRLSGEIKDYSKYLSDSDSPSEQSKIDIAALLAEYAHYTDKLYHIIEVQKWEQGKAPELRGEFSLADTPTCTITGEIPNYDFDIFHLRDISLNLTYKDQTITLNNLAFHTVEPPSQASLQAAFEQQSQKLGFRFESTTSIIPMLKQFLDEEQVGVLNKITHAQEHAPTIFLSGSIKFGDNFTLNHIFVNGKLEQKQLLIGKKVIDNFSLDFFYENGNFNINKLQLNFGKNNINLSAAANQGKGQAMLQADVNIEETLALINELTPEPIKLPAGLTVGEHLQLDLKTDITTPIFQAGQTAWHQFTPDVQDIDVQLSLDKLGLAEVNFTNLDLSFKLSNIKQQENKLPTAAENIELQLQAAEISAPQGTVSSPALHILANEICYRDDKFRIANLKINSNQTKLAESLHLGELAITAPAIQCSIDNINYSEGKFTIAAAQASAEVENLNHGELNTGKITLQVDNLQDVKFPRKKGEHLFSHARLQTTATDINYQEQPLGSLQGNLNAAEGESGAIDLHISMPGHLANNKLSAYINWSDINRPVLKDIQLDAAPNVFTGLLKHFGINIPQIQLPAKMSASGEMAFNITTKQVEDVKLQLNIPELVRTPCRVKAFNGEKVPIGLQADITMQPNGAQDYDYKAKLRVSHNVDRLDSEINGSTAGTVHVTGTNTIRADVVDKLIDSQTAHDIIRDFSFRADSRNIITDIDVKVDYANGLSVDSYCNVELKNVGYQLCAIEEDNQGNEKLVSSPKRSTHTTAGHATCFVRSKVRYDIEKDGKILPDECAITIGNITMNYDNTPWLSRQDFQKLGISREKLSNIKKLYRTTTLKGDAVIIDVENSFVELVNIKGAVYPSYSLGMFYSPLHEFLEDVRLPYPAAIETESCVFPIFSDCKRPMSGNIRVESNTICGFDFLGTTIPLHDFNGFIHITDDYVLLDRMNAACWQGSLDAIVKIGFSGERTSFDGLITARNMSLKSILSSYNTEYSDALCSGQLRFRSPTPDLKDIQGYGEVSIVNGDLMGFTIFNPIGDLVSDLPNKFLLLETSAKNQEKGSSPGYIARAFSGTGDAISSIGHKAKIIPGYNHIFAYDIQDVYGKFAIAKGLLKIYDMNAIGYNLDVKMKLDIDLDTLYIKGNLWPSITSLPTVVLSPLTFLSDFMIDIVVFGNIDNLDWEFGLDPRLGSEVPAEAPKKTNKPIRDKKASKRNSD